MPSFESEAQTEVTNTCADFLIRWLKRQWGLVGEHFLHVGSSHSTAGENALLAKDPYGGRPLSSWRIQRIRHEAAAVARAKDGLSIYGGTVGVELRWVRLSEDGAVAPDWESVARKLAPYEPNVFME